MKKRGQKVQRLLACLLAVSVSMGAVSFTARAQTEEQPVVRQDAEDVLEKLNLDEILTTAESADKEETVYVLAGADGEQQKVLVSTWLKNPDGADALPDQTNLTDLENLKGDSVPAPAADGSCTWQANGEDVYYQGTGSAQLPVTVSVRYMLDGVETAPQELAGRSGHLSICYTYENHDSREVTLNGGKTTLYVPYLAMTAMVLDNEVFRNVQVTNGKLVNDGDHTVVVGLAMPGLQESLNIDANELELPTRVELSADVTDFELGAAYTLVTNALSGQADLSDADDGVKDLTAMLQKLEDAMSALLEGSGELYDGLCTLEDSTKTLVSGVNTLTDGGRQVAAGAASLQGYLGQLSANNDSLNSGAYQTFQAICASAQSQLNPQLEAAGLGTVSLTPENYSSVIENLLSAVGGLAYEQAKAQVQQAVEAAVRQAVTQAVQAQANEVYTQYILNSSAQAVYTAAAQQSVMQALMAQGMTQEQAAAYLQTKEGQAQVAAVLAAMTDEQKAAAIQAAVDQLTDEQKAAILQGAIEQKMASDEIQAQIASQVSAQLASDAVKAQIDAGLQSNEAYQALLGLKAQLDSYNTFYTGLLTYTGTVAQLYGGSGTLASGAAQLSNGLAQLQSNCPALLSGVGQLKDGAAQLKDGLQQLSDEGVDKLVKAADGDIAGLTDRLKALSEISAQAQNYGGLAKDATGSVKYIWKLDGVEA